MIEGAICIALFMLHCYMLYMRFKAYRDDSMRMKQLMDASTTSAWPCVDGCLGCQSECFPCMPKHEPPRFVQVDIQVTHGAKTFVYLDTDKKPTLLERVLDWFVVGVMPQ